MSGISNPFEHVRPYQEDDTSDPLIEGLCKCGQPRNGELHNSKYFPVSSHTLDDYHEFQPAEDQGALAEYERATTVQIQEQLRKCGECGWVLALHRIGDDACPIASDGVSLEFSETDRFKPRQQ